MASVIDRYKNEPDKQGGKRWQVRWRDEEKKYRRKAFEHKAQAEKVATEIQHQLDLGIYKDPRSGSMTFEEYATSWLKSRHDLRTATKELYEGFLKNHLLPFLREHSIEPFID